MIAIERGVEHLLAVSLKPRCVLYLLFNNARAEFDMCQSAMLGQHMAVQTFRRYIWAHTSP